MGAAIGAAAIGAAGSIGGSLISSSGAKAAAKQQAWANQMAAMMAQQRYDTTRNDLLPYNLTGQSMLGPMSTYYQKTQSDLDTAFNNAQNAIPQIPTQATLLNMPGYQFALDQGLKSLQAQESAKGLGLSGAATKAAQNYSTGLAQQYLKDYFQMGQTQFSDQNSQFANAASRASNVFNQLYYPATLGESAAAGTGQVGANLANTSAAAAANMGQANATGTGTSAGALSGGLQNAANTLANGLLTNAYANPNGSSGTGLFTGIGNLLSGNAWDGMASGSNLANLSQQAASNVSTFGSDGRGVI